MKEILKFLVGEKYRKKKEKQFINPYEIVLAVRNRYAQLELSYLKEYLKIQKEKEKLLREFMEEEDKTVIGEIVIDEVTIEEIMEEDKAVIEGIVIDKTDKLLT